jgi:ATP-dependent Clp protease protease subunit
MPFHVPGVFEKATRTYQDIYSRLLKERIILLDTEINEEQASIIVSQLLFLDSEDTGKDIHMYINSPGGTVTDGLATYDTMQYCTSDVSTYCVGEACSMAAILLAAGTPGKRGMLPNARAMIHQVSSGYVGQVTDLQIHVKESERLKTQLVTILSKHTGQSEDKCRTDMERDYFMTPEEAVAFGLVDKILTKKQ